VRGAVLNRDDESFEYLAGITPVRWLSYGVEARAELRAEAVHLSPNGLRMNISGSKSDGSPLHLSIDSPHIGRYNIYNFLAAAGVTAGWLDIDPQAVQIGIAGMPGIPGRMELIDMGQNFSAIVDFAHTPNALRRALETGRELASSEETARRVIAVFGSAGLRDVAKRRIMAETAAELADQVILTAEDPRTEALGMILQTMADGASSRGGAEGKTFWRIPDRGDAIRFAVGLARPGDVILACGKGHEQSMCFGEQEYAWDDRTAMRAALAERLGIAGPDMPELPTRRGWIEPKSAI
jgi:UDP-N-acetylmuramoyl-L-alanyl-D-glutamate--2,6-diaminopimelate ligase